MRPLVLVLLLAAPWFAGCGAVEAPAGALVGYPRLGDVVTYHVTGAHVELARWENGHAFPQGAGEVRFSVREGAPVVDGARQVHPAFRVDVARNGGAGFVGHATHYVSPAHQALVQSYYPLSTDQGVVAFDERGFPWLFGASVLFGEDLARQGAFPFLLPDNLGLGAPVALSWRVAGDETVAGVRATRLVLEGSDALSGELWMEAGSAWPVRARLAFLDDALAPAVKVDAAAPVTMEARRTQVLRGEGFLPGRERTAGWHEDDAVGPVPWNGEAPPDGSDPYASYPLGEAVRDAKLLDRDLAAWLEGADDPRLTRATHVPRPGPAQGTSSSGWVLQFGDASGSYHETEMVRVAPDALGAGVPMVNRSGPADPPADPNRGWFDARDAPDALVPLATAMALFREAWAPDGVEIYIRSSTTPPGYGYYFDGGYDQPVGRFDVLYNPATGRFESAQGHVSIRFA